MENIRLCASNMLLTELETTCWCVPDRKWLKVTFGPHIFQKKILILKTFITWILVLDRPFSAILWRFFQKKYDFKKNFKDSFSKKKDFFFSRFLNMVNATSLNCQYVIDRTWGNLLMCKNLALSDLKDLKMTSF